MTRPDTESKRLHVLQVSHDFKGPFRLVCHQYAKAFCDHHVTTVYLCGEPAEPIAKGTLGDVIFLNLTSRELRGLKLKAFMKLAKVFRRHPFDVVIAHRYKAIYLVGVLKFFFPFPVFLAVAHEYEVFRRFTRRWFVTVWQRSAICIGVSESVSQNIAKYCGSLQSQGRLYTLPNGIDTNLVSALVPRSEARDELAIPASAFCFGTVGRLVDKKDHSTLLRGFARVCSNRPSGAGLALVIVGAGPEEARLRRLAAELGIESQVIFAGHLEAAARYLLALDVFVLSSGNMEAFGFVLLEAMLARRPVVCSDAPGPSEVVADAGLLFRVGDADELAARLEDTLDFSPDRLLRMGEAGYQRAAKVYSLDAFDKRLWSILPIRALTVGSPPL